MSDTASRKTGLVAVVGRPNVGKSTLINHFVGQKVSIVSDKPQTTRRRALGIATTDEYQIVFVDTPGIHQAHHRLGKILNETARQSVADVDLILVVVDVSRPPSREDEEVAKVLESSGYFAEGSRIPILLCLNKMDLLKAEAVQRHFDAYTNLFRANQTVMTSLRREQNADILLGEILQRLPVGDLMYPEDEFTDQSTRFIVSELVREQALRLTHREVPHALATTVDQWEDEGGLLHIGVTILVEREGQKAIIIGKRGAMLKEIGSNARREIEALLERKIFLELFVKVRDEWRSNPRLLKELDYL